MLSIPNKRRRTEMLMTSTAASGSSASTPSSPTSPAHHHHQTQPIGDPLASSTAELEASSPQHAQQQAVSDRLVNSRLSSSAVDAEVSVGSSAIGGDERKQLRLLALEVEPIVVRQSLATASQHVQHQQQVGPPSSAVVGKTASLGQLPQQYHAGNRRPAVIVYRPTYRAVLAMRGYLVKNTLGSGSYSKVKKVLFFDKGSLMRQAAVKIIDRQKAPQDYQDKFLPRELKHWPQLRHPNLVALLDCFQDTQRVYMILEYAEGGDALKHIQSTGAIAEDLAQTWTGQIVSAVNYMHSIDIAHRDLKLENLLIDSTNNVKLCDFGFVREAALGDLSQTYCGSKSYAAPEILQGRPYDPKKADVWAIGVILYIFVTGKMPFDETKGTRHVLDEQRNLDFHWSRTHLTFACQNLIRRMFTWHFEERPSINSVRSDSWIRPQFQQQTQMQQQQYASVGNVLIVPSVPGQSLISTGSTSASADDCVYLCPTPRLSTPRPPATSIVASLPPGTNSPATVTSPRRTPLRRDHWTTTVTARPAGVQASLAPTGPRYPQSAVVSPTSVEQSRRTLMPLSSTHSPASLVPDVALPGGPTLSVVGSNDPNHTEQSSKFRARGPSGSLPGSAF